MPTWVPLLLVLLLLLLMLLLLQITMDPKYVNYIREKLLKA